MKYRVQKGTVEVKARSAIHDTTTRFDKVAGTIQFDPDDPSATEAEITVDMRSFDAGDRFKNWKIKSDLQPDVHPTATFKLTRMDSAHEPTAGRFEANAVGQLSWHGQETDIKVKGKASVVPGAIEATATFELDVKKLGVSPPRFLMFKVEDQVVCQVSLRASKA